MATPSSLLFEQALKQYGIGAIDEGMATRAEQMWSILDELAENDPKGKLKISPTISFQSIYSICHCHIASLILGIASGSKKSCFFVLFFFYNKIFIVSQFSIYSICILVLSLLSAAFLKPCQYLAVINDFFSLFLIF